MDGTGVAASFYSPSGVATDNAGNVYVADLYNHSIRKITPAGAVTTLAGQAGVSGSADGTGAAASFNQPYGIATDSTGNVYVADSFSHTIRKITPAGLVTTLAGKVGVSGSADGIGTAASFNQPYGIATDSTGNVFVADSGNNTIRKITPDGAVTTFAGKPGVSGSADGTGAAASFFYPSAITADSGGNIYVTDSRNNSIRKITPLGAVTTLAGGGGSGSADGTGAAASFYYPVGIATDGTGNVFAADTFNHTVRKITPSGAVTTLAGVVAVFGSADGTGAAASFKRVDSIATDSTGNVFAADTFNHTIRKITPSGAVTTLAGSADVPGSADGTGAVATFNYPQGIATDRTGNIYVADTGNHTIRKITPAGAVTTLAGKAGVRGSADGTGVEATFDEPSGIAIDSVGNVYVTGAGSNDKIRKITPAGVVTTLVGGFANFGLGRPTGMATDSADNLYVVVNVINAKNNVLISYSSTVRKITPAGVVTSLAGTEGVVGSADGVGAAASFNVLRGIATDSAGNVYVADTNNNTIRKITPAGAVTTLVGTTGGQKGFRGGDLPGVLQNPLGLAISGTTLYISTANAVVRVSGLP